MVTIKSSVTIILRLLLKISCCTRPVQTTAVFVTVIMLLIARVAWSTHLPWLVWPSGLSWIPVVSPRKSICPTAVNILIRDVILIKLGFHMCSYCLFTLILLFLFFGCKERQINVRRARRYKSGQTAVWRIDLRAKRPVKSILYCWFSSLLWEVFL